MKRLLALIVLMAMLFGVVNVFGTTVSELREKCNLDLEGDSGLAMEIAKTKCNYLNEGSENIILAQRMCDQYARLCDPKWDADKIANCKSLVETYCNDLNAGPRQDIKTKAQEKAPKAIENILSSTTTTIVTTTTTLATTTTLPATTTTLAPVSTAKKGANAWLIVVVILVILIFGWLLFKPKKK